jgi:hypothetical protein
MFIARLTDRKARHWYLARDYNHGEYYWAITPTRACIFNELIECQRAIDTMAMLRHYDGMVDIGNISFGLVPGRIKIGDY